MSLASAIRRAFLPKALKNPLLDLAGRYGSDKGLAKRGHGYTRVYHHFFRPLREHVTAVLEIGLQRPRGHWRDARASDVPSLRMWRDFFPNALLVGLDIREFPPTSLPDCVVLQGDQGNEHDLARAAAAAPAGYDIVIDDGSHASEHQQLTFARLFPLLRPGGLYVIEDLHWQPEEEPEHADKTREVFRRFIATGELRSRHVSQAEAAQLVASIAGAWLFDSLDDKDPVYAADALLVVKKSDAGA